MKTRQHSVVRIMGSVAILAAAAVSTGCLERELKPLNPCLVSGVTAQIAVTNIDKVDLLFMVDDSGSMREEQGALRDQFPKLINTLTTGMRQQPNGAMDPNPFPPAKDLHLGVVTTDMGLVGISGIGGCTGVGDDGILRDPTSHGCMGALPGQRFLAYTAGSGILPATLAANFACVANDGTDGCGFEQQLESPLKALWPSVDSCGASAGCDVNNKHYKQGEVINPGRISFLKDAAGNGGLGHGDRENAGFLRNDPQKGLSLIAVVVVSDEEDCSSANNRHFTPNQYLNASDPLYMQDLNLRCFYNPQNLYKPERYIAGFKALREGNEQLVVFATITGVPPDLVDTAAYSKVDWSNDTQREQFYAGILTDPRMIPQPDPSRMPGDGNLKPSCVTSTSTATPPQRIVEVARGFGANGLVKSICTLDQFGPAMDAIIEIIAKQLGAVCLPRPLVRQSDGTVGCSVVWELPPPGVALPDSTPTSCGGTRPYLLAPEAGSELVNSRKGQNCRVAQLAVNETTKVLMPSSKDGQMEGWYYDNYNIDDLKKNCPVSTPQRVAFTKGAPPPTGVTVRLECLNETQTVVSNRTDVVIGVIQPSVGTQCSEDSTGTAIAPAQRDAKCAVQLKQGKVDTSMICHPEQNVCVQTCTGDTDCPPAWVCDKRNDTLTATMGPNHPMGVPICVNPTCGTH